MEKFREALKHSDTVFTVLTGVGETYEIVGNIHDEGEDDAD